jgi:mono/diheme cytochrome c family protein
MKQRPVGRAIMKIQRLVSLVAVALAGGCAAAQAADSEIERGKYLVTLSGCNDCHTPGYFLGKPDFSRALSGSDVGFSVPGVGAFVGRNLTPDKETGLGNWTDEQIIAAITAGVRPDGRRLAPIMPYQELSHLTSDDAKAIVAYLRSLPAVKNAVPGPFGPKEVPSTLVFVIVPGDVSAKMQAPK